MECSYSGEVTLLELSAMKIHGGTSEKINENKERIERNEIELKGINVQK